MCFVLERFCIMADDWFPIKTSNNPKMPILEFEIFAWKFIPNEANTVAAPLMDALN